MKKISLALYVLTFGIIVNSCNDPSTIGSELLAEDQVDVFYTDTIQLTASTIKEDDILTFDPNPSVIYDNFLVGDYTDPIFGNTFAGLYAQLVLNFDEPDYDGVFLDSIVLTLQYDSLNTYGLLNQDPFSIGVYQLTERADQNSDFFSSDSLMYDPIPLSEELDFMPLVSSMDSIKGLLDYTSDSEGDTIDIAPSLRMHLPTSLGTFGLDFINYPQDVYSSNTSFIDQFNGIHVRPLNSTPSMLSFDISNVTSSGLTVYYRRDTVKEQYNYSFSSRFVQFNSFKHDFTNTVVEDAFDDTAFGDSLLFLQAMAGPNIKIDISNTDAFDNVIINKAELEFTVAELPGSDPNDYPAIETMIAADFVDDEFVFLSDVLAGGPNFGGSIIETIGDQGETLKVYRMNISAHFQEVVDGLRGGTIYFRAFPKQEQSGRVVIYGPGHSKYPMKLSLTYTQLN